MPLAVKLLVAGLVALALFWTWVQHRARTHEARAEALNPPQGEFVEVNGHRVHAAVMGDGPDLVLLHGSSGNTGDMTLSLAPELARDYRVIVLDRPGLGYTDRINTTGATITEQAALLSAAAQKLGAEKPSNCCWNRVSSKWICSPCNIGERRLTI